MERILFLSYILEVLGHPPLHEMKTPPPDLPKPNGPLKFTHFQSDNAPDDDTSDQFDTRITQSTARAGHTDDNNQRVLAQVSPVQQGWIQQETFVRLFLRAERASWRAFCGV